MRFAHHCKYGTPKVLAKLDLAQGIYMIHNFIYCIQFGCRFIVRVIFIVRFRFRIRDSGRVSFGLGLGFRLGIG